MLYEGLKFTKRRINMNHIFDNYKKSRVPSGLENQLNGKTAMENYIDYKRKWEREQEKEELEKKLYDSIMDAVFLSVMASEENITAMAGADIIATIQAAFDGGKINPGAFQKKTFATDLGIILGRALADAPFKILEELFRD